MNEEEEPSKRSSTETKPKKKKIALDTTSDIEGTYFKSWLVTRILIIIVRRIISAAAIYVYISML